MPKNGVRYVCLERKKGFKALLLFVGFLLFHIVLELIKKAAAQTNGKTGKALAPVMMTLITSAKKNGIQFTGEEMTLILDVLKDGKSKEEQTQIDQMVKMVQHYMK